MEWKTAGIADDKVHLVAGTGVNLLFRNIELSSIDVECAQFDLGRTFVQA